MRKAWSLWEKPHPSNNLSLFLQFIPPPHSPTSSTKEHSLLLSSLPPIPPSWEHLEGCGCPSCAGWWHCLLPRGRSTCRNEDKPWAGWLPTLCTPLSHHRWTTKRCSRLGNESILQQCCPCCVLAGQDDTEPAGL